MKKMVFELPPGEELKDGEIDGMAEFVAEEAANAPPDLDYLSSFSKEDQEIILQARKTLAANRTR